MKTSRAMAKQALLEVFTAPRVQMVYTDFGSGADSDISVFQAELKSIPEGSYMIGQVAVPRHVSVVPSASPLVLVKPLVEKDESGDLIKPPVGYELVWNDRGSGGYYDVSFWRVKAPVGYVALGDVAWLGYDQPSSEFTAKYACIRQDLLSEGALDPITLWTDRGSGADMYVSIWKVKGDGIGGLFIAQSGYDKPTRQVFVLPAKVSK